MEKERKITAPEGCKIEKVEIVDGAAVITFKEKERKLPKSWEEFIAMFPMKTPCIFAIRPNTDLDPTQNYLIPYRNRLVEVMEEFTEDRATAEAVLALCQLIQLRNCYNGDWVPDWTDNESKFDIDFIEAEIYSGEVRGCGTPLFFKTKELRDEFLCNFRPLIEKLRPLYGIKEEKYIKVDKKGGEE